MGKIKIIVSILLVSMITHRAVGGIKDSLIQVWENKSNPDTLRL